MASHWLLAVKHLDRIRKLRQLVRTRLPRPKTTVPWAPWWSGLEPSCVASASRRSNLYKSHPDRFTLVGDSALLLPLVSLPGWGIRAALHLDEERKMGPFKSIEDLAGRGGG